MGDVFKLPRETENTVYRYLIAISNLRLGILTEQGEGSYRGDSPFPPSKNVSLAPRVPIRTIRLMIRAHVAAKLPQTLGPFRTRSKPEADAAPALDDADMADAAPAPAAMPGQRRRILRFLNIPAFPSGGEPCLCTAGEFLRAQHGPSRFYVSRQPPRLLLREDASRFSPAWNRPVVFGR
jgi:hypothetical protein